MYRIVCLFLVVTGAQAIDFGSIKGSLGRSVTAGGVHALTNYGLGGSAKGSLASGLNKSVSTLLTKAPPTFVQNVTSAKDNLLKAYKKHAVGLMSVNPSWKKDMEITYGVLNNFLKKPLIDAATQKKIQAYVIKANNVTKLVSLLVKMNGAAKPNDVMWNTVISGGVIAKTSDLVNFDDLTSALESLNKTMEEFKEVLEIQSFYPSVTASRDMLTQSVETPSIDVATNKQLQLTIETANNQAASIPTIFASLASTKPLSPGDDQWSFLEPEDKSKKYDSIGNESLGSIGLDALTSLPSKGIKNVVQENKDKARGLAISQAFAQTKTKQDPILTLSINGALASLQQVTSSLDSDSLAKLETINFSSKLHLNLLEIFSKNRHLTSSLQLANLVQLVKVGKVISVALPHIVKSQWTILPGDALWSFFVDEKGRTYTITELAAVAASQKLAESASVEHMPSTSVEPMSLTNDITAIENLPSTDDIIAALSALTSAYQQYESQLKANIEQQWISNIEQIGTQLDTLSKDIIPDSSSASLVITANNMVKAFPMLAAEAGGAPGDEQWSTLVKDGKRYSLEGDELP